MPLNFAQLGLKVCHSHRVDAHPTWPSTPDMQYIQFPDFDHTTMKQ
jgi:hypothetical protein